MENYNGCIVSDRKKLKNQSPFMFRNYFRISFRSLSMNKGFGFLNVFGLALGLTCCLLILFFVLDELSYDKFNTKAERIYRVNTDTKYGASFSSRAIAAPAVALSMVKDFPEVEKAVRLFPDQEYVKKDGQMILEDKMAYTDADIFDIFTLPAVEGNLNIALIQPHSVVITESTAKKYFNTIHVIGKTFNFFGDSSIHHITGVIQDIPMQSHFHFDFFLSMVDLKESYNDHFNAIWPFSTYLLLKKGAGYKDIEAKFPNMLRDKLDFYDALMKHGDYLRLNLTPLLDIHLQSNRTNELGRNGNMEYVKIFSAIALFILIVASINFMNLSTARYSSLAREVGVRKVLGCHRKNLVIQFLAESLFITFLASLVAVFLAWAFFPFFKELCGKDLMLTGPILRQLFPLSILIVFTVGILAGVYPAFFLSSFRSVEMLNGKIAMGFKAAGFRSMLVVFQFSISIILIAGSLVIYRQLRYIEKKDIGFNRTHVLVVKNMNDLKGPEALQLKNELIQLPGITTASLSSFLPTGSRRWINYVGTRTNILETQFWPVDENYLTTLGMQLAQGRDFSKQFLTDTSAMIINETAAKMLGFQNNSLDQKLFHGSPEKEFHIIGVVKDFNFSSLRKNISPLAMTLMTPSIRKEEGDGPDNLIIRVNTEHLPALVNRLEKKWESFSTPDHFDYSFMDEDFNSIYQGEQRIGKIFMVLTLLTLLIASLGIFGLAAFAAEQRTKEISIRKVLGASMQKIVMLLSKDLLRLVCFAMLIGFPIAWLLMQKWLQDFAYRVDMSWWVLPIAGVTALGLAFITVSYQSVKAANANPINSLRAEK
jgi:putative ABC transport system permease protein